MKKLMIFLLLVMPFALILIVSAAGFVVSTYEHVSLQAIDLVYEKDEGTNKQGDSITELNLGFGQNYQLAVKYIPENATNTSIDYITGDQTLLIINEKGFIKARDKKGSTTISILSVDGGKRDTIIVNISETHVTIKDETLTLNKGDVHTLNFTKNPANLNVVWENSNPSVATINEFNQITAHAKGTTTLTAKVEGTELTDSITITVEEVESAFEIDFSQGANITGNNSSLFATITTSTFDLSTIVKITEPSLNAANISYEVSSLDASITGSVLQFSDKNKLATVIISATHNGIKTSYTLYIRY